jgi:DNA-binding NtrC family response regulator
MKRPPTPGIDIAVLDDDSRFWNSMVESLEREGSYRARTFSYADDLFEACRHRLPHVVLLDVKMGAFHGERVIEQLLAQWPELCVVIVTCSPSLEDMRATFKLKVFDYLAKPCTLPQLLQTLQNAADTYGFVRSNTEQFRHRLGHRIRILRVDHDWSLKDLADATGLSASQISSIERGKHSPSMESLLMIASALKHSPSELLASIGF